MDNKTKVSVLCLALALGVGAVGVTTSWFVKLDKTPIGSINSAIVRYLPEGEQSLESLATYGNLVSGTGIDIQGVPHILPGDRLLPGRVVTVTGALAEEHIDTTVARPFEPGDAEDTVIHRETRTLADGTVAQCTQRDVMRRAPAETVWKNGTGAVVSPPTLDESRYRIVTTSETVETHPGGSTVTTSTTTTTYTLLADLTLAYTCTETRVTTVTHQAPEYVPAAASGAWNGGTKTYSGEERVLQTDGAAQSRTALHITVYRPARPGEVTTTARETVPLQVGNLSTTATNLRMGVTAMLTPAGPKAAPVALEVKRLGNTYYFGKHATVGGAQGVFIELLCFTPAAGTDFAWTQYQEPGTAGTAWTLWDLTLAAGGTVIPPVATAPETPQPAPVYYPAVGALTVAATSAFGVAQADFEQAFNTLYCSSNPTIRLDVRYYAKQSDYMDWTQFHGEQIHLSLAP